MEEKIEKIDTSFSFKPSFEFKNIFRKCINHPQQTLDIIHLSKNVKTPRICILCAQDNNIPYSEMIAISKLYSATPMSVFSTYPVLTYPEAASRMESILGTINTYLKQVEVFYDDLTNQINAAINKIKAKTRSKLIALAECYHATIDAVKNASQIEKFQALLREKSNSEKNLIAFIQKACKNSSRNTESIEKHFTEYERIRNEFDITQPNKLKETIIRTIESINLFNFQKPFLGKQVSISSINLTPSKDYSNSRLNTDIDKDKNGKIVITHRGLTSEYAQCYISEPLSFNVNYIFRFEFIPNSHNNAPYFTVGLIDQQNKDKIYVGNEGSCYYQSSMMKESKSFEETKLDLGNRLFGEQINIFELRIHMKSRCIQITNYPQYTSVVQLKNSYMITRLNTYHLAFHLQSKSDAIRIFEALVEEYKEK